MLVSPLQSALLKRAVESGHISVRVHDIRQFAEGPHRSVDDIPYGGGAGMVFKPEPLVAAVESIPRLKKSVRILLSPRGVLLKQETLERLAQVDQLILICGRYEGVDERVCQSVVDEEISIGDYVLAGGEVAAWVVMEGVTRLISGVLGNETSTTTESFERGLLEYPQYTRPRDFRGLLVPEVLLSGDHAAIDRWRRKEAVQTTWRRRPEMISGAPLTSEEKTFLRAVQEGEDNGEVGSDKGEIDADDDAR